MHNRATDRSSHPGGLGRDREPGVGFSRYSDPGGIQRGVRESGRYPDRVFRSAAPKYLQGRLSPNPASRPVTNSSGRRGIRTHGPASSRPSRPFARLPRSKFGPENGADTWYMWWWTGNWSPVSPSSPQAGVACPGNTNGLQTLGYRQPGSLHRSDQHVVQGGTGLCPGASDPEPDSARPVRWSARGWSTRFIFEPGGFWESCEVLGIQLQTTRLSLKTDC